MSISVADTGPGIDTSMQKDIFDPFIQVNADNTHQGTGLGLAISKKLLTLMGGRIQVQSELGIGSTFVINLPVKIAEHVPSEMERWNNRTVIHVKTPSTILIAEDSLENVKLLSDILKRVGFPIIIAYNGKQAVELFKKENPDFIWMDMRMPIMDGYEATRNIRALPNGSSIPILAPSASVFIDDKNKMLHAGCNDVIFKPYRKEEIFNAMKQYLDINYLYKE